MADMHGQPVVTFVVIGEDVTVPEAPCWQVAEQLTTLTDWQTALETVIALTPQFVVVDGDRFAPDALTLARQVRLQTLPVGVLLATDRTDPVFFQEAALAGVDGVIPRHPSPEQLHRTLLAIADTPRWRQSGIADILNACQPAGTFSEVTPTSERSPEVTVLMAEAAGVPEVDALEATFVPPRTETDTAPQQKDGAKEAAKEGGAVAAAVETHVSPPVPPTETAFERPEPSFAAGQRGRVIALSSGRGGVGKTTVLVNLAIALAQETNEPIAVLDLFIGDTLVLINATARMTISEIPEAVREVDLALLQSCALRHETGVHFFTWFFAPERNLPDYIDLNRLEAVLKALREGYPYILVDTPVTLYVPDLELLRFTDEVIVIAVPWDLLSVRATRALTMGMRQWGVTPKLLLNRVESNSELSPEFVANQLGLEVWDMIPNNARLAVHATNSGEPIILNHPESDVATAIRRAARRLAGLPVEGPRRRRFSLFF